MNVIPGNFVDAAAAHERHAAFDFALKQRKNAFDASLPSRREAVEVRPPDRTAVGAERQGFQYVRSAPDAAVDDQLCTILDAVAYRREIVDRSTRSIELPPAVV